MNAAWGLETWSQIDADDWPNLLLGNGASIAVSPTFAYNSLHATCSLGTPEQAVFTALNTTDFELVLDYLRISEIVCQHLHGAGSTVGALRANIRAELKRGSRPLVGNASTKVARDCRSPQHLPEGVVNVL